MINEQLLDYIRKQIEAGIDKESIKTTLISQGWLEQDVNESFMMIEKSTAIPVPPANIPPPSSIQPSSPIQSVPVSNGKISNQNTIWTKGIPRTNMVFMVISLLLVFGLDLLIIISSPSLAPFWFVMLGVLAVFAIFFYLENFVFRRKFANTTSVLDKWISIIIVLRNIVFILNFIPVIQLLGLAIIGGFVGLILTFFAWFFAGGGTNFGLDGFGLGGFGIFGMIAPIMLILYITLIVRRFISIRGIKVDDSPIIKERKRGSFLIPLLIVLVLVSCVGGYMVYQRISASKYQNSNLYNQQYSSNQTPQSQNQINNQNEIANWKTYANTDYGFEFKYPTETRLMVDSAGVKSDHPIIHLMKDLPDANIYTIAVLLSANDAYPLPKMPWVLKTEEVYINGIKMTKTLYGPSGGPNEKGLVYLDYNFVINGQLYEFIADSTQPNVMDADIENLLVQMVYSFKATNKAVATNQNTTFQGTGTVSNIDGLAASFAINISGTIKIVKVDVMTKIYSMGLRNIKFADIKNGHTVRVYGSLNGDTITASTIYDDSIN